MKTEILQVPFDVVTREEALRQILGYLEEDKPHQVVTANPEVVMMARKDPEFLSLLKTVNMVVADGIGVVWASRLSGKALPERVAGCDLVETLFSAVRSKPYTVYFFGAAPGVAQAAKENMEKKYPGLKVVGVADGYYGAQKERIIIEEIQKQKPDILLVGLGVPKQEQWIYNHGKVLGAKVMIGVGGSLDVFAGKVRRAPKIFRKLGLEWFYRLCKEPKRFFRMLSLPQFAIICIWDQWKNRLDGRSEKK